VTDLGDCDLGAGAVGGAVRGEARHRVVGVRLRAAQQGRCTAAEPAVLSIWPSTAAHHLYLLQGETYEKLGKDKVQ
jgi:hypothetical protein